MKRVLFMQTTQIDDTTTVSEIQRLLSQRGAGRITVDYQNGVVENVQFTLRVGDKDIPFSLPCRWQSVEKILRANNKKPRANDSWIAWSRRVAWRQVLRWIEAQLALIETGMVQIHEVFLPYAIVNHKGQPQSMHKFIIESTSFLAIESKEETK